jgi:hypothetical protein
MIRAILAAAILLIATGSVQAGMEEADAAFNRGAYFEAEVEYRYQALRGDPYAQFMLARLYHQGPGRVTLDLEAAYRWYSRAADQGYEPARIYVLLLNAQGLGGATLQENAIKELRQLAEQGDLWGQLALGDIFYEGKGVLQDFAEALEWYELAARQGHAPAQSHLGHMHFRGEGTRRDHALAYAWLNIAVSNSSPGESRNAIVEARDRVAALLTPDQLAHAQNLAKTLLLSPQPEKSRSEQTTLASTPKQSAPVPNERVRGVQRGLAVLGYSPGPEDGILGSKTRAAIESFQADRGIPMTGEISDDLHREVLLARVEQLRAAQEAKPVVPELIGTGSGFAITTEGHILTNHHVVEECSEVRIGPDTKVNVVASDINVDLALLKGPKRESAAVRFREGRGIRPGDEVVGAGYPLQGLLTSDLNITTGTVSALAGPGNDRRFIQISAPVQPGNSGGPLLDLSGNVVGIIVGKLDAIKVAQATGDIPQNVNFAISALSARAFLDSQNVQYETAPSEVQHSAADVAAMARQYTVRIECWN